MQDKEFGEEMKKLDAYIECCWGGIIACGLMIIDLVIHRGAL